MGLVYIHFNPYQLFANISADEIHHSTIKTLLITIELHESAHQ